MEGVYLSIDLLNYKWWVYCWGPVKGSIDSEVVWVSSSQESWKEVTSPLQSWRDSAAPDPTFKTNTAPGNCGRYI